MADGEGENAEGHVSREREREVGDKSRESGIYIKIAGVTRRKMAVS
jgi:hypothetical protein